MVMGISCIGVIGVGRRVMLGIALVKVWGNNSTQAAKQMSIMRQRMVGVREARRKAKKLKTIK